jgi:DNA polymerase alpha subunit B
MRCVRVFDGVFAYYVSKSLVLIERSTADCFVTYQTVIELLISCAYNNANLIPCHHFKTQAHSGRLNSHSLLLEGSRAHSSGSRISLDLPSDLSYSLFPGQIVALEGMNSSGRIMRPISVIEGAPPPMPTSTKSELKDAKGVKIISMAGPYTTSDNLEYAPLVDAVLKISEEKPDVVILCGPFVDARQPLVEECIIEEDGVLKNVSHEYLFRIRIAELFSEMYENYSLDTQIVLVPSVDDAFLDSVYPQPPIADVESAMLEFGGLGLNDPNLKKKVHCVSNPATIKVNEVVIGVTSTDVLFHINCDSTSANLPPSGRLSRIAQHLIQQRSYYPLFPAAKGACLDLTQQELWEMPVQPDILITPSKLNPFAKEIMNSVVVNPGALTKNTTGGTYAVLDVHPLKEEKIESIGDDDEVENSVKDRVRVDIKRI